MRLESLVLALVFSSLSSATLADASAGIFAILDEVNFEPSDLEPDRVRLRGVFTLPRPVSSGLHRPPAQGELYFSLNPDAPAESRADWAALRAAAGTGQVVAFGQYWMPADPEPAFARLPEAAREAARDAIRNGASSYNTSLVVTLHTTSPAVLPESYPRPNSQGVITRFDSEEQLCPRFGPSSSEIVESLWQAHDPARARPVLPICAASVGLIDNRELDTVFAEQHRDAVWAAEAEALLSQRVTDSGVELSLVTIECRFTICHLGFVYPSAEYRRTTGIPLTNAVIDKVPGFVDGGKVEDSLRGEPTRDYWIQRRAPE
jgi:hypothetical protein